jgi:hypothetical protein
LSNYENDDIQLVYKRQCNIGKLKHIFNSKHYKVLNTPTDSDVYVYQKESSDYTISLSAELDLYNTYYMISGYARLKLLVILKQKHRYYKKHKHILLEVVRFATYIYYNAIIFRVKLNNCKIETMVTKVCKNHYTKIINTLYPKLKNIITFYYFV